MSVPFFLDLEWREMEGGDCGFHYGGSNYGTWNKLGWGRGGYKYKVKINEDLMASYFYIVKISRNCHFGLKKGLGLFHLIYFLSVYLTLLSYY